MSPPHFTSDFLAAIERAVMDRSGAKRGTTITFTCPLDGHKDEHPSCRYRLDKQVWYCPVCAEGGGALKLATLIGLDRLQGEEGVPVSPANAFGSSETSLTVAELAEAKGQDEAFLRSVGVADIVLNKTHAVRIPYFNPDGTLGATRYRLCLEKRDPDVRFRWKSGARVRLYGLDRLPTAGDIWLVEGESDCWTLWQAGEAAVGVPGAGNWNEERDAEHLERFDCIYAVVEPDAGGEAFRRKLMSSRLRDKIHLVSFAQWNAKDVSALWLADRDAFAERLAIAQLAAQPVTEVLSASTDKAVREAERLARDLLKAPDVMAEVRKAITAYGYAGDTTAAEIAYVALASTATADPVNVAFIAQSAAGKNAAIDAVRDFFPPETIYEIEAGSPTTLIYGAENYQHRCVLYAEADSIPDEGAVASAVRNLAWKKRLIYDVTERNEETGKFESRRIEKDGPTSLITTSTRSLAKQLGTRVFEVPIPDSAEQTRRIMLAHGAKVMPGYRVTVDLAPLVAYQQWLRLAGAKRVVIPFGTALMQLLPAGALRMRRDAKQVLWFIQAVAFMHQCGRVTTPDGAVIATLGDYEIVQRLLAPTLDTVVSEGVSPAVRETVGAVPEKDDVSLTALAKAMNLSTSTVEYRVRKALTGGWLVNREERRGYPKRLARGVPMPEQVSALPARETLEKAWNDGVSELPNDPWGDTDTPSPSQHDQREDIRSPFTGLAAVARQVEAQRAPGNVRQLRGCVECGLPVAAPGTLYCVLHGGAATEPLPPTGTDDAWEEF